VSAVAHDRPLTASVGAAGAALGVVAGLVELTVGPSIRGWVGDKADTTRLGLATILLAAIALGCALVLIRRRCLAAPARLALAAGLLIPGLVCFTTVGRLWYVPGVLLVAAGIGVAASLRGARRELAPAVARSWPTVLTVLLAAFYVFLGATALGLAGALGIAGGLLVLGLAAARGRVPATLALPLLLAAVIPFAALTWWSVATPLLALLLLAIGIPALVGRRITP
jgi:hypothetical protein